MPASPISKEEFQEWNLHPVTKAFKDQLRADLERLKDAWANGGFESSRELDAKVRGQCLVINQILNLDLSDVTEE